MIAKGVVSTDHPVMAHIIPIRRCNLACKYCNEYDDFSKPVPLETMKRRVDDLARLGTTIVTLSGGEPLLHPELDEIIAHMRTYPIIAGMITNGYLLTADRIQRLNRAGLDHLQISIDNVMPDDVSKKSLKVLDKKLQLLAEHAEFHVNINSVVGGGTRNPHDALVVGRRAVQLGFTSTIGIIHDGEGQLRPLKDDEREVFLKMRKLRRSTTRASTGSRTTSRTASRMNGDAAPAPATSISARTGWCITARSSAAIPAFRWRSTRWRIFGGSFGPKRAARRTARSHACTRCRTWISGALRRRDSRPSLRSMPASSCKSSRPARPRAR